MRLIKICSLILYSISILCSCNDKTAAHAAAPTNDININAKLFDPNLHDWPHSISDIEPDPRATFGRLKNGLRYIILPVSSSTGGVSMRMQFAVGAEDENPKHYGISHLLEHMAFKGSKNLDDHELFEIVQGLGASHGKDANAFTTMETTFYIFDFPNAGRHEVKTGLFLFSEIAQHLTLNNNAMETERSVVLAELLQRDTPSRRARQNYNSFAAPTRTRMATPIGGMSETISAIKSQDLHSFYKAHYRPKNTLIVIAGDIINSKFVEREIKIKFASWRSSNNTASKKTNELNGTALYKTSDNYYEKNLATSLVGVMNKPSTLRKHDIAEQEVFFTREISNLVQAKRLRKAFEKKKGDWVRTLYRPGKDEDIAKFTIGAKKYPSAIKVFDQERRRTVQHGFLQSEIDLALSELRIILMSAVDNKDNIDASAMASAILLGFNRHLVLQNPSQSMSNFNLLSSTLTRQDYHAAFKQMWEGLEPRLWMKSSRDYSNILNKTTASLKLSRSKDIKPYEQKTLPKFSLSGLESPGEIISSNTQEKTGIVRTRYSNGVRLNYKRTQFKNNEIKIAIYFDGNFSQFAQNFIQSSLFLRSLNKADFKNYTRSELREIFAGKKIDLRLTMASNRRLALIVTTNKQSLKEALQVATAFITDIDYASQKWKQSYKSYLGTAKRKRKISPLTMGMINLDYVLSNENHSFSFPQLSAVKKNKSIKAFEHVMSTYLRHGQIEIGAVGDFEIDLLISHVGKTFGALPKRTVNLAATPKQSAQIQFTNEEIKILQYTSESAQMGLFFCWRTAQPFTIANKRKNLIMSGILTNKVIEQLRVQKGVVYSPFSYIRYNELFPNFGYSCEVIQTKEEHELTVRKTIANVTKELANGQITQEEFDRVRMPLAEDIRAIGKTNSGWLHMTANAQTYEKTSLEIFRAENWYDHIKLSAVLPDIKRQYAEDQLFLIKVEAKKPPQNNSSKSLKTQAGLGQVEAQIKLAKRYAFDRANKKQNIKKAIYWYEKAILQNSAEAHHGLARIYSKETNGMAKKPNKSAFHFIEAKKLGLVKASYRLARLYYDEQKIFPNVTNKQIINLYVQAAEAGHVGAQLELSQQLQQGSMAQRDEVRALKWLFIARSSGKRDMIDNRIVNIRKNISTSDQEKAQRAADDWLKIHKK